ncbi:MAG: threonine--tRNA ligase, partial [Actinomycetota bacterium]
MPKILLPDGHDVALPEGEPLGSIMPAEALAARFDGALVDLSSVPDRDGRGEPVSVGEHDGLHVLRHSTAHVMAQAVCDVWPGARYAIGPPVEDGFYYDFELPQALSPDDLEKIEARMAEIVADDQPFVREELSREEALERFADQRYKREVIEGLDESEGAGSDRVTVYRNGEWSD